MAVCISQKSEAWLLSSIPFYCHTEGWKPFKRERTRERVVYLAERRNSAVGRALKLYPESDHVLMVDSYYLEQVDKLKQLLEEYNSCEGILGASTWQLDKTRIRPRIKFFDSWTTPEATSFKLSGLEADYPKGYAPQNIQKKNWLKVRAVGACYVYPRYVWEENRYGIPESDGCEHNFLCEHSRLPVWLSPNVNLWREPVVYSWPKRIRCTLNLGQFLC